MQASTRQCSGALLCRRSGVRSHGYGPRRRAALGPRLVLTGLFGSPLVHAPVLPVPLRGRQGCVARVWGDAVKSYVPRIQIRAVQRVVAAETIFAMGLLQRQWLQSLLRERLEQRLGQLVRQRLGQLRCVGEGESVPLPDESH